MTRNPTRPDGPGIDGRSPAALPIDAVLGDVTGALQRGARAVVVAEPGSGKTTRVPLALAAERPGRVLVLEPRRVAARAVARYLAAGRGEPVGVHIGLTTRDERRVGPSTRVEFITEGILTNRLQRDPGLDGVSAVVFDEFHERSLAADTGLALVLDVASSLRPDLWIVVMSATIDAASVGRLLGGAPVIDAPGRRFPVTMQHRPVPPGAPIEEAVSRAVREALTVTDGDVLAFLPGAAEIGRVARRLDDTRPSGPAGGRAVSVLPLHGRLSAAEQDAALAPALPGRRKVVLATNVAESSLTVDGVTAVVDSGLVRRVRSTASARFDRLDTERVSQAEADQRAGRAGRLGPGVCFRLWAGGQAELTPAPPPEVLTADLAGLALELTAWGVRDPATLRWLDPPPPAALADAARQLVEIGLLDGDRRPTADGRLVVRLGVGPRVGALLLAGARQGPAGLRAASRVAALVEDGDVFRGPPGSLGADLRHRLDALDGHPPVLAPDVVVDDGRRRRLLTRAAQLQRRVRDATGRNGERPAPATPRDEPEIDAILLGAMADRVAQRRTDGSDGYRLRHGGGVRLPADDPLGRHRLLIIVDASGGGAPSGSPGRVPAAADPLVRLAVPLEDDRVGALAAAIGAPQLEVRWDPAAGEHGDVAARLVTRLDELVLRDGPAPPAWTAAPEAGERIRAALLDGVRRGGIGLLGNVPAGRRLQERVQFCRRHLGPGWPDVSDEALLGRLDDWLAPYLAGARRARDLAGVDCRLVWWQLLGADQRRDLDRWAPPGVQLPTGRIAPIDYGAEVPTSSVKLQELFGVTDLPRLAGGAVRLRVALLSPAGRPVAVTDDLDRFWSTGYPQVRAELRGRYPKHPWPQDPLTARPTAGTNRANRVSGATGGPDRR